MSDVLLNLDTLVVRPKIKVDGKRYDILAPEELPVLTTHLLASKGKRLEELANHPELGDDEKTELTDLIYEISDAIMEPVPAEVRDKLSEAMRVQVIEAFSTLLLTKKAGTAAATLVGALLPAIEKAAKSAAATGAKRSRGSSGSTGVRRGGGSPKPRSRS